MLVEKPDFGLEHGSERMECPKCGTWNPEDKAKCWRCSAELPLPPQPRKSRKLSSQTWLWVMAILFALLTFLAQCGFLGGDGDQGTGFRQAPTITLSVVRLELHENEGVNVACLGAGSVLALGTSPARSL